RSPVPLRLPVLSAMRPPDWRHVFEYRLRSGIREWSPFSSLISLTKLERLHPPGTISLSRVSRLSTPVVVLIRASHLGAVKCPATALRTPVRTHRRAFRGCPWPFDG